MILYQLAKWVEKNKQQRGHTDEVLFHPDSITIEEAIKQATQSNAEAFKDMGIWNNGPIEQEAYSNEPALTFEATVVSEDEPKEWVAAQDDYRDTHPEYM